MTLKDSVCARESKCFFFCNFFCCVIGINFSKVPTSAPTVRTPTKMPTKSPIKSDCVCVCFCNNLNELFCKVKCPNGTTQIGNINADISSCGLDGCNGRYTKNTIQECRQHCLNNPRCLAFNWAPLGGDKNHLKQKVCTIYDRDVPTHTWGPKQIFCKMNIRVFHCQMILKSK